MDGRPPQVPNPVPWPEPFILPGTMEDTIRKSKAKADFEAIKGAHRLLQRLSPVTPWQVAQAYNNHHISFAAASGSGPSHRSLQQTPDGAFILAKTPAASGGLMAEDIMDIDPLPEDGEVLPQLYESDTESEEDEQSIPLLPTPATNFDQRAQLRGFEISRSGRTQAPEHHVPLPSSADSRRQDFRDGASRPTRLIARIPTTGTARPVQGQNRLATEGSLRANHGVNVTGPGRRGERDIAQEAARVYLNRTTSGTSSSPTAAISARTALAQNAGQMNMNGHSSHGNNTRNAGSQMGLRGPAGQPQTNPNNAQARRRSSVTFRVWTPEPGPAGSASPGIPSPGGQSVRISFTRASDIQASFNNAIAGHSGRTHSDTSRRRPN